MVNEKFLILVINPGSTSTKFALFENEQALFERTVRHPPEDFADCASITEQHDVRLRYIMDALRERDIRLENLSAVVGRGGMIAPLASGTYAVNELMLEDLHGEVAGLHASCLGAIIAADIAGKYNIPSFVVDPAVVDEMIPEARLSGLPQIPRESLFHALNTKAVGRLCAREMGMDYNDARFVICHMGGGITTSAHRYGRVIDATHGMYGEGAFTPERSGLVYGRGLIEMAFSGNYSKQELLALMQRNGGIKAYLGLNDMREVEQRVMRGEAEATLVLRAMIHQLSKDIGGMIAVLGGRCDAAILTGGIAFSAMIVSMIKEYVAPMAPLKVYPGELEMEALAQGGLRVLRGEEKAAVYAGYAGKS
ncbi:MAG: butyrate kinase [Deltaproteobacteria bacterium]|jgi:butyrate kinase|nr:butyrate kinase [Deltaproteobacteria bacterium]